ncbi:unnamed protein product [Schistosoma turkestanicum]|nr:unnamed protein product [Schistosoma turkestanicum]
MVSNNDEIPRIDLENFEDPRFRDSKYVLTSPRSLEACANLGIPPVDLLHKSRAEFLERFKKLPPSKIEELYIRSEEQRRNKLLKARLERWNLVQSNSKDGLSNSPFGRTHMMDDENWTSETGRNSTFHPSHRTFQNFVNCQPSLTKTYSHLIEKLQPTELRRIELMQRKYQQDKIDYTSSVGSLSRNLQNFVLFGQASRPKSAVCQKSGREKMSSDYLKNSGQSLVRRASCSSLDKERQFWKRKQAQEQMENDERERAQKCYEEKLNKVEQHRNQIMKEKERSMIAAHHERAKRVRQVLERRKQLREMVEEYRRELYEAREQSIQRAAERVSCRLSEEQKRLASERRQKQMQVEENAKEIQRKEQELRKAAELALQQKDEHIRRIIEEKEARIQQSRNLALAAESLREEMLRVYNLDSFDKKVQKVTLINEMGLNGK